MSYDFCFTETLGAFDAFLDSYESPSLNNENTFELWIFENLFWMFKIFIEFLFENIYECSF